ncbi:UDP-N-acetylmuramate dehydrogenase [Flavobacterium sp.]|uniref:UDP-N-acetylmuramate dehydrogenase n=1 Tax=Flavobacterium sp. TaxID=239 RepID=UPI00262F5448|nr:UDP-N-acetylmuramate dehydrogenase [Flavobacterium sp.]
MTPDKNVSLKPFNTFGIDVTAQELYTANTLSELVEIVEELKDSNYFVLNGGSNILLSRDIAIPVVRINFSGIEILDEDDDFVWIKAQAGQNWHELVVYCLENGYGGLENLSLIPGNTGTAPMQNIGAYGVEIKDVMVYCEALHRKTAEFKTFHTDDCQFAYRESIFKGALKGTYIITSVVFKLTKRNHQLHLNYGDILQELEIAGISEPTPIDVSRAVIKIRQSKLPDPNVLGNSGSFFKNPIISADKFAEVLAKHPDIKYYLLEDGTVKIPAGYLIEKSGYKGFRRGDAGVHEKQALVLVNYGSASGPELYQLALEVKQVVLDTFDIAIEPEVNLVPESV